MLDKDSYMFNETLRDGTPITLRAARADVAISQMFLTPSSGGSPARISIVTLPF
jgi:hypothetical protein